MYHQNTLKILSLQYVVMFAVLYLKFIQSILSEEYMLNIFEIQWVAFHNTNSLDFKCSNKPCQEETFPSWARFLPTWLSQLYLIGLIPHHFPAAEDILPPLVIVLNDYRVHYQYKCLMATKPPPQNCLSLHKHSSRHPTQLTELH